MAAPPHQADDFALQSGASTISDVHWTGFDCALQPADTFRIDLYAYGRVNLTGPVPAEAPFESRVVTATVTPGAVAGLFEYYAVLPAVVLAPDTRFWISIAVDEDTRWFWAGSAAASQSAFWHPSANDWAGGLPFAFDFALTIDVVGTTIPGPSALLLLGVGLVPATGAMRVRKK